MTYQELLEITKGINFDNVGDAQYTTGNGWTNARWSTQSSFMQFLTNCLNRNAVIRFKQKLIWRYTSIMSFPSRTER